MQDISVFEYKNYRTYLNDWISNRPRSGYGERSRWAKALACNPAYISFVLGGTADFALEQAERLSLLLQHLEDERHFFLLLVQYERSGTQGLKSYFRKQIDLTLQSRSNLKDRLQYKEILPTELQATYYSSWYYSAIHIALSIPKIQTRDDIHRYLNLPVETIEKVLGFLVTAKLVNVQGKKYRISNNSIHLGSDSPFSARSHANWRVRALTAIEQPYPNDFHYSSVVGISREASEEIRMQLIKAIEGVRKTVLDCKEEELYVYSLDLFKLGG